MLIIKTLMVNKRCRSSQDE